MYYNADLHEVEDLLKNKYKAKKISFKNVTQLFPCCGIDNKGYYVEIDESEKTIELYTEEEITAHNFYCYIINDINILRKFTDTNMSGGIVPEKVLTVIGMSDDWKDLTQIYTCFGKCYAWYVDLINIYARHIEAETSRKFRDILELLSCSDGVLEYKFSHANINFQVKLNLHTNEIILCGRNNQLTRYPFDEYWADNLNKYLNAIILIL